MSEHYTALGLFNKIEPIVDAVDPLKDEFGIQEGEVEILTSAAYPDGILIEDNQLEHMVEKKQFLFPFLMGIVGFVCGVLLAGGTGYIMNIDVGGKSPFSYAPTGIITYEFTLLFGVIGSVISLLYIAGLPNWSKRAYDSDISDGALGLLMKFKSREDRDRAADYMEKHGAYKVRKGENDF